MIKEMDTKYGGAMCIKINEIINSLEHLEDEIKDLRKEIAILKASR